MTTSPYQAAPNRYQSAVRYRRSGHSGIMLPEISLGLWKNFGSADSYDRSRSILLYAFDHGITHFDLANNYGPAPGSAEETLGRVLRNDLGPYRDELFISTKAGYDMWPGPYGSWCSRKSLMASLDQSLRRMGLDYADLFYVHRYDPETPVEETLQALVDIVRAGKALYIGISRWPAEALEQAVSYLTARNVPPLIYQGRLNLLDRAPVREGTLSMAEESGLGFIAFSPLAQGLLTGRYLDGIPKGSRMERGESLKSQVLTPELREVLGGLNELAVARGESMAQMALAWLLQQQGVTSVLVGCSSCEQLADSLTCSDSALFSAEELQYIDELTSGIFP